MKKYNRAEGSHADEAAEKNRFTYDIYNCRAPISAEAEEIQAPDVKALGAVLMDEKSGRVLWEKNGYEPLANASTTKIMTCILAIESGKLDETVTASKNAAVQPKTRMGLSEGEQLKLKDLLYALMLQSSNDCSGCNCRACRRQR